MRTVKQEYVETFPVADLVPHPENPNKGDDEALAEMIDQTGFYGAVIAQASTRRLLAGHTRWRTATSTGATSLPVIFLDVDDDEALRILLGDNRSAELAVRDNSLLAGLLQSLAESDRGLSGTGYDPEDLNATLRLLAYEEAGRYDGGDQSDEWTGMPEFSSDGVEQAAFSATFKFRTHEDAAAFFKMLDRPKRATNYWPAPWDEGQRAFARQEGPKMEADA